MGKRHVALNPAETISAMRSDALLAYLEWPVFLHIRLKELNEALAITGENQPVPAVTTDYQPEIAPAIPAKAPQPAPEPTPVVNFVPELPPASEEDAMTDFLAQFPDGEGSTA